MKSGYAAARPSFLILHWTERMTNQSIDINYLYDIRARAQATIPQIIFAHFCCSIFGDVSNRHHFFCRLLRQILSIFVVSPRTFQYIVFSVQYFYSLCFCIRIVLCRNSHRTFSGHRRHNETRLRCLCAFEKRLSQIALHRQDKTTTTTTDDVSFVSFSFGQFRIFRSNTK